MNGTTKKSFLSPRYAFAFYIFIFLFFYSAIPFCVFFFSEDYYFLKLSIMACSSIFFTYFGCKIQFFDVFFSSKFKRIYIPVPLFVFFIWLVFLVYVFYVLYTAESIPFLSAIYGAGDSEVSAQRGAFLKGRSGYESLLIYVGTIFSSVLIPYTIILMFAHGYRFRYALLFFFFFYCISFMAKSLFLSVIFPLVVYFSLVGRLSLLKAVVVFLSSIVIMFFFIYLVSDSSDFYLGIFDPLFFTSSYIPNGPFDYFIWRAFSVPIFTASESLLVFERYFDQQYFFGGTSSLLSSIFNVKHINFERFVFMYQFGSWNDTANSNSYFVIDSYVNFSFCGVLIYSFVVGLYLRFFKISKDIAFSSLWLLFIFHLFSASLIGTLLSNGFLLIFFISVFLKIGDKKLIKRNVNHAL